MPKVLRSILGRFGTAAEPSRQSRPSDLTPIGQAPDRAPVRVAGRLVESAVRTHGSTSWLEATLRDDSGELIIVWMGRCQIPGIEIGRELLVEGRLAKVGAQRRIYNPIYTLL